MSRIARCAYQFANGVKCENIATIRISCADRGNRNICYCAEHNPHSLIEESYYTENKAYSGKEKKNNISVSCEFETYITTAKANSELIHAGFLPTSDGSICGIEFKSPIYLGLNSFSKFLPSIENLVNTNDIKIDNKCGTHFHVGFADGSFEKYREWIIRFYHSLFVPLCEEMKKYPIETEKLFGRNFTHYANTIDYNSYVLEHENFINLEHDYTIEFRLCKFNSAKQYRAVMWLCRKIFEVAIFNFAMVVNENMSTEQKKQLARKAGEKIKKAYLKTIENLDF